MNYKRFVPPGTFIHNYLVARSKSCAPIEFEFWCALWVLSCIHDKTRINGVSLHIHVALLCANGVSNVVECIDFAHDVAGESRALRHYTPDEVSVTLSDFAILVLNETRRKGDLFATRQELVVPEPRNGALIIHPNAADCLNRWNQARRASHDKLQAAFESVEHLHILRVAALLALNEGTECVNGHHMRNAIQLIRYVKNRTFTALTHGYARDKASLALEKITQVLRTRQLEPIKSSELYLSVRHWIDVDTFHFCMDIMHELKFVTKYATSGKGRRLVCYKATESLLSDDVVRQVLKEVDLV